MRRINAERKADLCVLHAAGWKDRELAAHLDCHTSTVEYHRKRLGLPNRCGTPEHYRNNARAQRARLAGLGVRNFAELRAKVYREEATSWGFPDLRIRQVQIIRVLSNHRHGLTRRELASAIGVPWCGNNTMSADLPAGNYLADLLQRGLLRYQHRRGKGGRRIEGLYLATEQARDCLAQAPVWEAT